MARLGRIPSRGDQVEVGRWRLTVASMDRHRIAELRLSQVQRPAADTAADSTGTTGGTR